MHAACLPQIIQGGMGGVSGWRLARAVSCLGALGVVSGTALAVILARRLQLGDPGGHMARGASKFPYPAVVERIFERYFVPGGKDKDRAFKPVPMPSQKAGPALTELTVLANFVEVALAKENHDGVVGINYLEKIQLPTLPSIFGAMLAGVDCVLMGAGIPRTVPGVLDAFAQGATAQLEARRGGCGGSRGWHLVSLLAEFCQGSAPTLKRPLFLGIISSDTLASVLVKKATGSGDGFVVEGASAGGHNAPPRGALQLNSARESIHGSCDIPDLEKIKRLGLPFWLAGSFTSAEKLAEALSAGASGVQVGTPFAFCEESDIDPELKRRILDLVRAGRTSVLTDPAASPTGFPFKVLTLSNSLSDPSVYSARKRVCDLGYLRHIYRRADGTLGYRCPAEPIPDFQAKGGSIEECEGRKCVCNGLLATVGLAQIQSSSALEHLLSRRAMTSSTWLDSSSPANSYTAADVIGMLLREDPSLVVRLVKPRRVALTARGTHCSNAGMPFIPVPSP